MEARIEVTTTAEHRVEGFAVVEWLADRFPVPPYRLVAGVGVHCFPGAKLEHQPTGVATATLVLTEMRASLACLIAAVISVGSQSSAVGFQVVAHRNLTLAPSHTVLLAVVFRPVIVTADVLANAPSPVTCATCTSFDRLVDSSDWNSWA